MGVTFFVDPGNRAYVRRINFINTSAIDDEVLGGDAIRDVHRLCGIARDDDDAVRLERLLNDVSADGALNKGDER